MGPREGFVRRPEPRGESDARDRLRPSAPVVGEGQRPVGHRSIGDLAFGHDPERALVGTSAARTDK
jgi:hypothetical protein